MNPRIKPPDSGIEELFRSKLKNIINLRHEPVRLGELIDWARLGSAFCAVLQGSGASGSADPAGGGAAFAEAYRGCRIKRCARAPIRR